MFGLLASLAVGGLAVGAVNAPLTNVAAAIPYSGPGSIWGKKIVAGAAIFGTGILAAAAATAAVKMIKR